MCKLQLATWTEKTLARHRHSQADTGKYGKKKLQMALTKLGLRKNGYNGFVKACIFQHFLFQS